MKKLLSVDKYKFNMYDEITSIIFNEESVKNNIVKEMPKDGFIVIDSKTINTNIRVSDFLKTNDFDMRLVSKYNIKDYLGANLLSLSVENQLYLKIIVMINSISDINIVFADVLSYLSEERKKIIFKTIFDKNIKYFNFTSDIEEVIYSNYLIVLSKDGVALEGNVKSVLGEEKLLKRLGFSLPVIYDISLQLKSYGVIDKPYIDMKKLVNDLWK